MEKQDQPSFPLAAPSSMNGDSPIGRRYYQRIQLYLSTGYGLELNDQSGLVDSNRSGVE